MSHFSEKSSIFQTNRMQIPSTCKVVFVADLFKKDYSGGAELTSDALIKSSPIEVFELHSRDVTIELLKEGHEKFWIFGNFSQLDLNLIPTIVANMAYSVLEYDYKYCKYRSPEKHQVIENVPCDCHEQIHGKLISAFYHGAKSLWWMSEKQMDKYHTHFPFLKEKDNTVLSSVFDDEFFATIKILREKYKDTPKSGWVFLGGTSWIKGVDDAKDWCVSNNLQYTEVWNMSYDKVLDLLARSEGLVFLPKGGDTCPRMTIEAKLLGCKLHLNDHVQHKDELWFDTDDLLDTESYLYAARSRFWEGIKHDMEYQPKISGYTTTKDCIKQNYPFVESISSMLGFCDQVVVVDGGSTDGTWEKLEELAQKFDNILIHKETRDWKDERFAVFDGAQKALARSLCTGDFCWQQDSDEIVHECDYDKIRELARKFPAGVELISLPVIEYWGGPDKVRMDIFPWKWRISRNVSSITHGIPAALRKTDSLGRLYASLGTDGCDYIHSETFEPIPHASFYTKDVDDVRRYGVFTQDKNACSQYEMWFNIMINDLPCVHHYSWYHLERKIKTYRDYWSQHWQSLYDIKQEDTAENNMFFQKPWSDVSDQEISDLAKKLASEMGGWIFHTPIDWQRPTPSISVEREHPNVMSAWRKDDK